MKHADIIRQVAPVFRMAFLAYLDENAGEFEMHQNRVTMLEAEGDLIKRNIRGHLPRGILLPMDKFQLLWYLREQDRVLDGTQDALHWLSYRKTTVPDELVDDLLFMVERANQVLASIFPLVERADRYFQNYAEKTRAEVKQAIRTIRDHEQQSDLVERKLLSDILSFPFENSTSAYHLARLVEIIGNISNHAENAADMMRAMIAK
jgi:predicted phosphate transport protein (TIGR00153 family)